MKQPGVTPRRCLNECGARPAQRLVARQADLDLVIRRNATCKHRGVFDRHGRALRQKGQGGVACIAQQRDASVTPFHHGRAVKQRPFETGIGIHVVDQCLNRRVPAFEVALQLAMVTARVPGLDFPPVFLDHAHHVHQLSRPYVVMHEMFVRSPPYAGNPGYEPLGEPVCRNQAAPRDVAGETRIFAAEQVRADCGVDAVRADQQHPVESPFVDGDRHSLAGSFDVVDARVAMQGDGGDFSCRFGENVHQVGTMDVVVGKTIRSFDLVAQRARCDHAAALPVAHLGAQRNAGDLRECRS